MPPAARRHDQDYDDYDDEYDDEPRRRDLDPTGGLIPLKNGPALAGYYCGVFGMIPFFGIPLSIAALVLGIIGLKGYKRNRRIGGAVHAWVAIIAGSLELLGYLALFVFVAVLAATAK